MLVHASSITVLNVSVSIFVKSLATCLNKFCWIFENNEKCIPSNKEVFINHLLVPDYNAPSGVSKRQYSSTLLTHKKESIIFSTFLAIFGVKYSYCNSRLQKGLSGVGEDGHVFYFGGPWVQIRDVNICDALIQTML